MTKVYKDPNNFSEEHNFEEFLQGFNMADPLCDYVDAGTGKECSDVKLKGGLQITPHYLFHLNSQFP
jgi:hypothetical protein